MGITVGLILLVIVLAYNRFVKKTTLDPEAEDLSFFPRLIAQKWRIDELYNALFEKPYTWFSKQFNNVGERMVMVPIMNGTGRWANKTGKAMRMLQSGNMSFYLFGMVAGIVLFLVITIYA
jgi:NADH-quinone oxidoreductase subunit L